jgi:hypothetical protein
MLKLVPQPFWREGDKSRVREGRVLAVREALVPHEV